MKAKHYILPVAIAALIGVGIGSAGFLGVLKWGIGVGLAILMIGVVLFFVTLKENGPGKYIVRLTLTVGLVYGIALWGSMRITHQNRVAVGEDLVEEILDYQTTHAQLPQQLTDLDKDKLPEDLTRFNYQPDFRRDQFSLAFLYNGWHFRTYYSASNTWKVAE